MSIIIVLAGIAILILVHEFGHFIAAKFFNVKVEEFGFGFPPRLFSKKIGETRYSFNLLPFGGFVRLLGESPIAEVPEEDKPRSFSHQKAWRRATIIVAGVVMNFLLGWFILSGLFLFGTAQPVGITAVLPDSPAEQVGLKPGDIILGFDRAEDFISFVNENRGAEIRLNVKRGEETLTLNVVPRAEVPPGQGALGVGVGELGFPKLNFLASIGQGFLTAIAISITILVALFNLVIGIFTGQVAIEQFVGPVGIFQVASQAGGLGIAFLFNLVALISLNLMVLNIFPFPALDGGRLLFLLIEKIKGSPISPKRESAIIAAGFIFLLLLMIAITIKDIVYLF